MAVKLFLFVVYYHWYCVVHLQVTVRCFVKSGICQSKLDLISCTSRPLAKTLSARYRYRLRSVHVYSTYHVHVQSYRYRYVLGSLLEHNVQYPGAVACDDKLHVPWSMGQPLKSTQSCPSLHMQTVLQSFRGVASCVLLTRCGRATAAPRPADRSLPAAAAASAWSWNNSSSPSPPGLPRRLLFLQHIPDFASAASFPRPLPAQFQLSGR